MLHMAHTHDAESNLWHLLVRWGKHLLNWLWGFSRNIVFKRLNWFRCLIFMSWTSWAGSWACGPEINTKLRQIFRFVVALKKCSDNEINSTLNKLSLQWESLDIWWFKPKKTPYLKTVTTQWEKKKWCICRMTLQKPTNGFVLVYLHWKNVFLKTN